MGATMYFFETETLVQTREGNKLSAQILDKR